MTNKPRKWWVAGLLSLLEPGLGQIYNGQARKGTFILVLPLFFLPLLPICINSNKFLFALFIFVCLTTIYYIYSIGDAVEIRDKVLQINSQVADEPYIIHTTPEIYPEKINPRDNFGPVIVPEGTCFVLGDNRDQSYDSRFWGFVKNSKIKGTVKTIYWSWDKKNMKIRWNRIGKIVQ